jgi:hypothetical protein
VAQHGDTLTFEPALFSQGRQTLWLQAGPLLLDKNLTLVGPGHALLVISAHRASGVIRIAHGATVLLTKLTITRGLALPAGGIDNAGTLTLVQSTVSRNTGSGIVNRATGILSLRQSRITGNTFTGLSNEGRASLSRSTVQSNSTGIANVRGGGLTVRQSTVSGNTVTGLFNAGELRLHTTILAGNGTAHLPNTDCTGFGTLRNDGFTLTGLDTGCARDPTRGDLTVDPARVFTHVLQPLRNNGGPTLAHALWPRSPALDAGDPARCGGTDQWGVPRPQGARCDIGTFEREWP